MQPKSRPDGTTEHFEEWFESSVIHPIEDFQDPKQEWRRLFSELLGTFFLVLVAAGGGMMGQAFPNTIGRSAAVTAAWRLIVFGKAWLIIPPPAATSTRKNVPRTSENNRRHS